MSEFLRFWLNSSIIWEKCLICNCTKIKQKQRRWMFSSSKNESREVYRGVTMIGNNALIESS